MTAVRLWNYWIHQFHRTHPVEHGFMSDVEQLSASLNSTPKVITFITRLCIKLHRYMFKKNCTSLKLARLLDKLIASKFALFSVSGLKDEKLIKKLTIHEN